MPTMKPSDDSVNFPDDAVYSLELVEQITRIPRERIVLYSQYGLVSPVGKDERDRLFFDDQALHQLSRIAFLLAEYGINQEGLQAFSRLIRELELLRAEVRFLRER